jgi:hypothetical protein
VIDTFLAGKLPNFTHERHVDVANILKHLPYGRELMHLGLQTMAHRHGIPEKYRTVLLVESERRSRRFVYRYCSIHPLSVAGVGCGGSDLRLPNSSSGSWRAADRRPRPPLNPPARSPPRQVAAVTVL